MRDYVKSTSKRRNLNGDIGVNVKHETPVKCNYWFSQNNDCRVILSRLADTQTEPGYFYLLMVFTESHL